MSPTIATLIFAIGVANARDRGAGISIVAALVFCSQGVIQNFHPYTVAKTVEGASQTIPPALDWPHRFPALSAMTPPTGERFA